MHKPTFFPATGGKNQGGNVQYVPTAKLSSRSLPSHQKLKSRKKQVLVQRLESSGLSSVSALSALILPADQDSGSSSLESGEEDDESGDDDDEDEEALLRKELEAIRREKELAAQSRAKSEREKQLEALQAATGETKLIRSWTEDAVFNVPAPIKKETPEYINDVSRSDFHKRFLARYVH